MESSLRDSHNLDYFRDNKELIESGDWVHVERNYLNKHETLNRTAQALTQNGLSFVVAKHLYL